MTVEKFLADGHKFVEGDVILRHDGKVITSKESMIDWNIKDDGDSDRFILRAAALDEQLKRTKVEYVKCNFECAWHAIKAFEDGEKLYAKKSSEDFVLIDNAPDVLRYLYDLHERIEIDERQEFIAAGLSAVEDCNGLTDESWLGKLFDSGEFKLVK